MVGEGHLGGDAGAETAGSGTENSDTGRKGRASAKARGSEANEAGLADTEQEEDTGHCRKGVPGGSGRV